MMPVYGIVVYACEKRGVFLTTANNPSDTVIVM